MLYTACLRLPRLLPQARNDIRKRTSDARPYIGMRPGEVVSHKIRIVNCQLPIYVVYFI